MDLISPEGFRSNLAKMATKDWWTAVDCLNTNRNWTVTLQQLVLTGGANKSANDDWVISKPVYIRKGTPDKGVSLNSVTSRDYNTPGTYKAVFDWYDGSNYSQVKLNIVVKE
jgi:hypothetical protein